MDFLTRKCGGRSRQRSSGSVECHWIQVGRNLGRNEQNVVFLTSVNHIQAPRCLQLLFMRSRQGGWWRLSDDHLMGNKLPTTSVFWYFHVYMPSITPFEGWFPAMRCASRPSGVGSALPWYRICRDLEWSAETLPCLGCKVGGGFSGLPISPELVPSV